MIHNFDSIQKLHNKNLKKAKRLLTKLKVWCGEEPNIGGLTGWVFEQTIQYCLTKEFKAKGIKSEITEQHSLGGRVKADLLIGKVAIEVKSSGLFSLDEGEKYGRYKQAAVELGLKYLFVTQWEDSELYRKSIKSALGTKDVFFLNQPKEWPRLVNRLVAELKVESAPKAKKLLRSRSKPKAVIS